MVLRRIILAAAMSLAAGVGTASADPVVWVGGSLVKAVSGAGCAAANVSVNELYTTVLHLKFAGDPIPTDVLQINQGGQKTYRFTPSSGTHLGNGGYNAVGWTGRATIKTFSGTFSNMGLSPAVPNVNTPFITVTGVINNYDNGPCAVTFTSALNRKP